MFRRIFLFIFFECRFREATPSFIYSLINFTSLLILSVPINSPTNLRAHNISATAIQIQWDYDDDPRLVLGDLSGYTLYLQVANADDAFTSNGQLLTYVRGINRSTLIDGLEIFRLYNVSIAAQTNKGEGPIDESVIVRTHGKGMYLPVKSFASFSTCLIVHNKQ